MEIANIIGEEIYARSKDRNDWEFVFFALFDGCNSAKRIHGLFSKPEWVHHNGETTDRG